MKNRSEALEVILKENYCVSEKKKFDVARLFSVFSNTKKTKWLSNIIERSGSSFHP